ncbi:MAG: hypothetical protein IPL38_01370 [Rhodobacter sp.]|nr:hypothetical protein [Rhodobacter sp.]MBK8438203.1 hypothetical protein [Rhodobacter sp.]
MICQHDRQDKAQAFGADGAFVTVKQRIELPGIAGRKRSCQFLHEHQGVLVLFAVRPGFPRKFGQGAPHKRFDQTRFDGGTAERILLLQQIPRPPNLICVECFRNVDQASILHRALPRTDG